MVEKINQFAITDFKESIVIEPGAPYFPKTNKFGFVEIPFVKTLLFAGDTEREFLDYTWSCTTVSSTAMSF